MTGDPDFDLSRREFMLAGTTSMLGLNSSLQQQVDTSQDTNEYKYRGVAHLLGPAGARPEPDSEFFEDKIAYAYIYESTTGARSYITEDDNEWQELTGYKEVVVTEASDLPEPSNGTHTLKDQTAYVFNGFVTSPYGLELGSSTPLLGRHGSLDGFIHTGQQTAITGTDAGFFANNAYFHSPGGTMFDLTATNTTEMLVESCAFSDAAGIAPISNLGQITGYRVPTFKGCNFEDFTGGLRFDGDPDKVFIWGSPIRKIISSGVTAFTLASTASAQIVDFADNYVKDVQPDTEVWRVEAGGSPSEVFQYRGTVHDTSVTTSNILTGEASAQTVGYWVSDSYPLRESNVVGEISLDTESTTTISAQNTWYQVAGPTTLGNDVERTSSPSNGVLQYNGKKNSNIHITVSSSFTGANGSIYEIAIAKNGTVEPASAMQIQAGGQNASKSLNTSAIEDIQPGDTVSLQVRNLSGTNDATFQAYALNYLGM